MDHDEPVETSPGQTRRRRAMPERDGPNRAPRGAPKGNGGATTEPPPSEIPEVIADAVRLGYQVIEENLRQGRTAADRFGARDYGIHDATDDVQMLGRRVVDLARDLGSSWFDLVAAVLNDQRLRDAVTPRTAPPSTPGQSPGGSTVAVCVIGHPSAAGQAFLEPLDGLSAPPRITPLRHLTDTVSTIAGVRLGADPETGALALLAPVPPDQPPGVYAGTVHDGSAERLLGSISLTVPPA